MLYANSLRNRLPETWVPGIRFCTKQVLRWGIILYGFRLTLAQVAAVGGPAVAVDLIVVTVTILGGVLLGRLLKIDPDTALMTSTGSAICGAAAVLGAEPVVKCEGYKTAIAVSTVVIFGTLSMFLYPILYRAGVLDGLGDTGVAIYTGSTLHEVAHVAGAGNAMDPTDSLGIAGTATITKMIRVMMLAPVLVIMSFALAGRRRKENGVAAGREKSRITIPWFAFGFIGVICLNSLLQHLCGVASVREIPFNGAIEYIDTFLLTMAMTALGTETSLDKFRQAGAKPFLLAGLLLRVVACRRLLRDQIPGLGTAVTAVFRIFGRLPDRPCRRPAAVFFPEIESTMRQSDACIRIRLDADSEESAELAALSGCRTLRPGRGAVSRRGIQPGGIRGGGRGVRPVVP